MAQYENHITVTAVFGVVYALFGVFILGVYPEYAALALALIIIAGMLPDIDAKSGSSAREAAALLAAVTPIALIEFFPGLKAGGAARIALLVIACYMVTRILVVRALQRFTTERGMFHSIPAAIIAFEIAYLIFWGVYWQDRVFIATAAFLGFLAHLVLDASGNVDLVGKAMGNAKRGAPALKFIGNSVSSTVVVYMGMFALGWFVVKDFYPQLRLFAGINY